MDLEQKVQALEQEVQLLKSQIQSTLLDIQEYILTNAYPSLRAEESSSSNGHAAPAGSVRPPAIGDPSSELRESPVVRNVSFNDPSVSAPPGSAKDIPLVKKVSLQNIGADASDETPTRVRKASPNGHTPSKDSGKARLDSPAQKPSAQRPVISTLLDDFDVEDNLDDNDDFEEETPRVAVRKVSPEPKKGSKSSDRAKRRVQPFSPSPEQSINEGVWEELEGWVRQKLEKLGAADTRELIYRLADRERLDEETKAALLTIVALYEEDMPRRPRKVSRVEEDEMSSNGKDQDQAKTRIVPETRVTLRALVSDESAHSIDDEDELNDTAARSLVMRLISGVRNAGPKPKRKNTHG